MMAQNGLNRHIRERELYRRYLHAWQEVIEISEELHQVALDPKMKDTIRAAVTSAKETQRNILIYLQAADRMFEILDEKLGEFPRSVQ